MKYAIVGSRTIDDYSWVRQELDKFFSNQSGEIKIVSGDAKGVDKLAEKFAAEFSIPIEVYLPKYRDSNDRGAPHIRNQQIVDNSDFFIKKRE